MLTNANNSAHDGAQAKWGNEQSAWNFHAKREYRQNQIHNEGEYQKPNGFIYTRSSCRNFNGRIHIGEVAIVITETTWYYIFRRDNLFRNIRIEKETNHSGSLLEMPHWLNSKNISWLMFSRVYGFGYEMIAVMRVTTITSVTGYWPSLLDLRKRHQYKLPLMKIVPITPCNNRIANYWIIRI